MAKKNKGKGRIRNVLAPFSPRQIRRETKARVRLEFGDTDRALRGDLRASQQNTRNIQSWYGQYQDRMNALRNEQAGNTQALQNQMNRNAQALGGQASARSSAVADDQSRSAAIRGAMTDPSAGATESAAETQRQALLASSRDRAAQMGASSNQRLAGVNSAAELGRQADQRQERNTRLETRAKLRDLARDKGASRVKNRGDIIRQERDYSIARGSLNLDRSKAASDAALGWAQENRLASQGSGGGSGGSGGSGGGGGGAGYRKGLSRGLGLLDGKYNPTGGGDGYDGNKAFNYLKANRGEAVNYLVRSGVPRPAARAAVRRYIKKWTRKMGNTPNSSGAGQPGSATG